MKIVLNDDEIRGALAEAIAKKLDYAISGIDPAECWFEVKAGVIDEDSIDDIHDVQFCYDTKSED